MQSFEPRSKYSSFPGPLLPWQRTRSTVIEPQLEPLPTKRQKLGIAAQLIIPFVTISLVTTVLLAVTFCCYMSSALTESLQEKSEIVTRDLASELKDPLMLGEYDRIKRIVGAAVKHDHDVVYAEVVFPSGSVVAHSDPIYMHPAVKPMTADQTAALAANGVGRIDTLNPNIFEIVAPIQVREVSGATLHMGVSTDRTLSSIRGAQLLVLCIGLAALLWGVCVYVWQTKRSITGPIKDVVRIASRISKGDLGANVPVGRNDEIGELLTAMNDMVQYLREMASVADLIAGGDLTVKVHARSNEDLFGNALQKMVESLEKQTKELAARELRFRSLCETSPIGIFETDRFGRVTYANAFWERISGVPLEEMRGCFWYKNVHPMDQRKVLEPWHELVASGNRELFTSEFRIIKKNGLADCQCSTIPLKAADGTIIGYVGTVEDITKRLAMLEEREEFIATLTHDLKNPLIGANRALELLADQKIGPVSKNQAELLIQLRDTNKRLLSLIQNLLAVYRLEKDANAVYLADHDLSKLASTCVKEISLIAASRNIDIDLKLPPKMLISKVDAAAIQRVFQNLMDNALKFTHHGGRISLELKQQCEQAVFTITDNGVGIATNEQKHLFQRFSQGTDGKKFRHGSGLGLYLCKQIVEAHKGTIVCASREGSGTTFQVSIPRSVG